MENKSYSCSVLEILDNGDAIIELPTEFLSDVGWRIGDELDFITEDKKIIVKNLTKENDHARNNNSKTSIG